MLNLLYSRIAKYLKETAYLKRVQHDVGILYMYNPCINIQTALDSQ